MTPRVPQAPARPRHLEVWARRGLPPLLVALVFGCFLPALGNGFVSWDDHLNFTENPSYRGLSPTHLRWMFTTVHGGHYQPLTWVTLGLDYVLWGMKPTGYHLTSVLLHTANALLVYFLVAALLRRATAASGVALRVAAAAGALFFALHPLRVESVAWASERRDVLSGFFYLLTILAYLRAQEGARRTWLVLSLGCFVLSLLSKAWGITLPLVLLALDVYPLRRLGSGRNSLPVLVEKIPYATLALAAALLAFRAVEPVEATRTLAQHGTLERAAQAAYGLCFYLRKTLLPLRLSPLYLLDLKLDPAEPRYVLSALTAGGITLTVFLLRHRWPWAITAWATYAVIVSPVLGLVQTGPQVAADRYTYLACLPWAVLVAAAVQRLEQHTAPVRRAGAAAVLGALLVLGVLTVRQTGVWRDSLTLWNHSLRIDPTNFVAYANRGGAREDQGDANGAMADYTMAIRIHPGYALAYYNRGTARHAHGDVEGAIADLTRATDLKAGDPKAWNNRGWAREAKGDLAGAVADYTQALRVAPPDFPGRVKIEKNLALARARMGGG